MPRSTPRRGKVKAGVAPQVKAKVRHPQSKSFPGVSSADFMLGDLILPNVCVTNVLLRGCSEEATNWNSSTACQIAPPTCEWPVFEPKLLRRHCWAMRMCSSGKQSFKKLGPGRQGLCGSSGEYTYQGYMGTPASFVVSPDTFCIQWILPVLLFLDTFRIQGILSLKGPLNSPLLRAPLC